MESHHRGASSITHKHSRPLNHLEGSKRVEGIEQWYEDEKARIDWRVANKYLDLFRDALKPHMTHNHDIRVFAGMGIAGVKINDKYIDDFHPINDTIKVLQEIDQILHSNSDSWVRCMDGMKLN